MKPQISNRLVIAVMFGALVPLSLAEAQKPSGVPVADARSVIALSQAVAPGGISELEEVDQLLNWPVTRTLVALGAQTRKVTPVPDASW